jgi:hypothetical protein
MMIARVCTAAAAAVVLEVLPAALMQQPFLVAPTSHQHQEQRHKQNVTVHQVRGHPAVPALLRSLQLITVEYESQQERYI